MTKAYSSLKTKAMTVDEWKTAQAEAKSIKEKAKDKSSMTWFKKVDEYYMKEIVTLKTDLEAKIQKES